MGQERGARQAPRMAGMLRTPRCFDTWEPFESTAIVAGDGGHAPIPRHPGQPPSAPRVFAGLLFARLLRPSLDQCVADFRSAEHDDS
jgi:hypothetical protein